MATASDIAATKQVADGNAPCSNGQTDLNERKGNGCSADILLECADSGSSIEVFQTCFLLENEQSMSRTSGRKANASCRSESLLRCPSLFEQLTRWVTRHSTRNCHWFFQYRQQKNLATFANRQMHCIWASVTLGTNDQISPFKLCLLLPWPSSVSAPRGPNPQVLTGKTDPKHAKLAPSALVSMTKVQRCSNEM